MRKGDNRLSEKCKRIARASGHESSGVQPPRGEGRTCTSRLGANQGTAQEGACRPDGKWREGVGRGLAEEKPWDLAGLLELVNSR